MDFSYVIWIPLIMLFTFLVNGLFGHKMKPVVAGLIGTTGIFIAFSLSVVTAYQYFFLHGMTDGAYQAVIAFNAVWLRFTPDLFIDLGIYVDPISTMMLLVITIVSLMVHIYSFGYMKGEKGFQRFYAFLSLFSFSMLGLVVATNLFQMYIFWELVGVSSYLLIGFYYQKPSAVAAAKKAFIVTRFADLGFLIGILLISYFTGTFDFNALTTGEGPMMLQNMGTSFLGISAVTWALLLVFMGGAGKSAMFPLHIWLPDAMEGPTPVSALIHAATMVVAGVYLVARLFPLFYFSAPAALEVVAYVGAFTALFAAIIACVQNDIKRVLAYSTMSQIGYMMLALGVSGYGAEAGTGFMASMFHLSTHAMFKALLFLGAGSIIHAVHSNYMKDMGNLRKYMPITSITFLIACLAIAGIPPFSGFFSKDEILVAAHQHSALLYWTGTFVAGLTAFYMFRLYYGIFWGKKTEYEHTPHESPLIMTIPLILLALGAALAGFIPFNEFITSDGKPFELHMHWDVAIISVSVAVIGIIIARIFYFKPSALPEKFADKMKGFYRMAYNKFYFDELYLFVTKKIIFNLIARPVAWFDRHIVDGTMNGLANSTVYVSKKIKVLQSGQMQDYAFVFVSGAVGFILILIYVLTNLN
jgi:NADH-quinone oxidoreductase subunit L